MSPPVLGLASLGVALGAGLLVGLEREQVPEGPERRYGGVRTFGILGLLGGLAGLMVPALGWWVPAMLAVLLTVLLTGLVLVREAEGRAHGIVSEVAALVVCHLGVVAAVPVEGLEPTQRWGVVMAAAVVTMSLLSLRTPLHALAERVSTRELQATAQVGLLLLVVVPILPRTPMGPWAINPATTGLLIALIATMNLAGYVALRTLPLARRTAMAALLGGLASTTAIARHFGASVKERTVDPSIAALAVMMATVGMFPRVLVEVAVLSPSLVQLAAPMLGSMAAVGVLVGVVAWLRRRDQARRAGAVLRIENPFNLAQVLRFGVVYVVAILLVGVALARFGPAGVYGAALLTGLTDIDALALAVARLHGDLRITDSTAKHALILAAGTNLASRAALAGIFGGWRFGLRVLAWLTPMGLAGALLLAIV